MALDKEGTRPAVRLILRAASLAAAVIVSGWMLSSDLQAEAYIAMREGYKCSQCHVNKTGGGKRNDFANAYVQTRLPQYFIPWAPPGAETAESAVANIYHGRLNDFFSVGADLRFAYAESRVPGQDIARETAIRTALLYIQMDMVPERASLYLDQSVKAGSSTRELLLLFDSLPGDGYVKLGQFFLASGWRLQDDSAFVRQYPGYTYGNPDSGIEIGFEPGPWSFALWSVANNDKRGVIGSLISKPARIGLSYSLNSAVTGSKKSVWNLFGGLHYGRFTFLGEVDEMGTETTSRVTGRAVLAELNYLITRGANLKLSYEVYDPDKASEGDTVDRISLVYEPFVTQFLQLRVGGRDYAGQTNNAQENRTELFIEVNAFFY
jgi:hypothetical protein